MKNYPHLYPTPLSKKVKNKTPIKSRNPPVHSTITTKASYKSFVPRSPLGRQKASHNRNLTRSIEGVNLYSDVEGDELRKSRGGSTQKDEELFSQSYSKIGGLRKSMQPRNIDAELNEVLNLIREQKNAINQKMKNLKKSNEQYRQICQNYMKNREECGINTENILQSGREMIFTDQSVGCQIKIEEEPQTENSSVKNEEQNVEESESYTKICDMLRQMNINPRDILPCEAEMPADVMEQYSGLSQRQIIQVQKFFIKKLIQKLSI